MSIGSVVNNPIKAQIPKCPNVLELRQILQYKPVMEDLRIKLVMLKVNSIIVLLF